MEGGGTLCKTSLFCRREDRTGTSLSIPARGRALYNTLYRLREAGPLTSGADGKARRTNNRAVLWSPLAVLLALARWDCL